ncbi:MAG: helix-turn-helix transcriptional regulator [Alphaproteobacteria bacterium]|nr:helix-turn-helix transcriptional regulator [Alphaproteobacteria bacterium]
MEKPNRNDRRRQRTREALLQAADRVFRRKGIDDATVNDLTDEADVAYGSFYNHFKTMDEIVSELAKAAIQRVADATGEILSHADRVELLPCIGARVVMRLLIQDPAIRWMVQRPYIFVAEFEKVATPFMRSAEADAVADGRLKPVGGHDYWLRSYPWLLIAELGAALQTGETISHEDRFAAASLRFLGVDDSLAPALVQQSRTLVDTFDITAPQKRKTPAQTKRARTSV